MGKRSMQSDTVEASERRRARIASAAGLQIIVRVIGVAASLITVSVTTRTLGPTNYGHLQSAIMYVALWGSFTELGINSVIVRKVVGLNFHNERDLRDQLKLLIRTNLGLSTLISLPLTILVIGCGLVVYKGSADTVLMIVIVSASLILTSIGNSFDPLFMVHVEFRAVALSDFLGRAGSMVLTVVLASSGLPIYWFAIVQLVPPFLQLVVKGFVAHRSGIRTPLYSWRGSKELVRESLPQTVILVVAVLYWRIDGVILSVLSTPAEVGLYGLAYALAFTSSMIPELFLSTTLSTSAELFSVDRRRFANFCRKTLEVLYLMALPLAVLGGILAGGIITLVGSSDFTEGGPVLAVLFCAAALTFINAAVSQALFAAHQQVFLMRINLLNLLINIVLNLMFAKHFGALGAASILVASEVLGIFFCALRLRRMSLNIQPVDFVAWCVPALALGASLAWVFSGVSVIIAAFAGAAGYIVAQIVAGPARPDYLREMVTGGAS
ncbi:flippase [Gordonia otitidis]|uniref:flippase n=1 Tax=Gordonia otitidis TaxID=249058 RepID=UPI00145F2FD5|nr:flippase [Gordonia otitidis]